MRSINFSFLIVFSIILSNSINSSEHDDKIIKEFNDLPSIIQIQKQLVDEVNFYKDPARIVAQYAAITRREIRKLVKKLHQAITDNNLFEVIRLINIAIAFNIKNLIINEKYKDKNPLELAIVIRNEEIAKTLIYAGIDIKTINSDGDSPLVMAILLNLTEIIELLLKSGAPINQKNERGDTPLLSSIPWSKKSVVQTLLNAKADVSERNSNNATALDIARLCNQTELIQLLTKAQQINSKT